MKFCSFCFMKLSLGVVQFHYMKASGINVADRIIAIFCKSLTSGEREGKKRKKNAWHLWR